MNNKIYIPIHSLVDVITNSSSVVYSCATSHAVEIGTEMIRKMMDVFGIKGEPTDYFNIYVCPDPNWVWEMEDQRQYDEPQTDEEFQEFINKAIDHDGCTRTTLVIESKDSSVCLTKEFFKMFELYSVYR